MTSTQDNRSSGNNRNGGRGGKNQKNPFAKDPVQKELDAIKSKQQKLKESFNDKLAEIRSLKQSNYVENIKEAREYLKDNVIPQLKKIKSEDEKLRGIMNTQRDEKKKFFEEMKELLPVNRKKDQSVEDHIAQNIRAIDNELSDLERQLMDVKSLKDEKHIVSSIEKVRNKKKQISSFKEKKFESVNFGAQLDELKTKKQPLLDELTKRNAIISENQKLQDANKKKVDILKKDLDEINKQRKVLEEEYSEKKKLLDVKWTEWKKEQAELKKKRDAEYKERKAKQEKEAAELEKQRKIEEANRPPMMDEIAKCDKALQYLQSLKYNKKKANMKIQHSLDAFGIFSAFKLAPPQRFKQIPESKAIIEKKKEEICVLQAEAMKKRAEEAAKKAEEAAKDAEEVAKDTKEEVTSNVEEKTEPENEVEVTTNEKETVVAEPENEEKPTKEEEKEEATNEEQVVKEEPAVEEKPVAEEN